jgi:hypothetical protein
MLKDQEQKLIDKALKNLETRFDKRTAHLKAYQQDIRDIGLLLTKGVIDGAEAAIYREQAEARRDEISAKFAEEERKAKLKAEATEESQPTTEMETWLANRKCKQSLVSLFTSAAIAKPRKGKRR